MHTCRAVILLASPRRGEMSSLTGILQWNDTGCLGSTGRGDKEVVWPSVSMTSWSA